MTKDDAYKEIEHSVVYDSNQLEIGTIEDFTFDVNDYKLRHFVIKGENDVIKDWLNVESKYSLLLPHEAIRRQSGNEVQLSVTVKDLKPIDQISEDEQRFTIMRHVDVIAKDGEDLGTISDGIFHKDNHFSLILGGTGFNKFMSRFGMGTSNNLFVPYRYLERFDTNLIKLKKNKEDLGKVIDNILFDSDGLRLHEQQKLSSKDARWELYNESLKDVMRGHHHDI